MITMSHIIAATSLVCEVGKRDLIGQSRVRKYSHARQQGYTAARNMTANSYPQIGRAFGDRDHTTIMHGIHQTAKRGDWVMVAQIEMTAARLARQETPIFRTTRKETT